MKEGWTYKKLGEIGNTQTGTTPSKSNPANYGDYLPFIRPAEISSDGLGRVNYDSELKLSEEGVKNGRIFNAGSILMVCIGSIGKLGYLEKEASCNQQINVLTPAKEYDSKYIFYAMSNPSFQKESLMIAQGAQATLPIINKSKWSKLEIPVPPTLKEQQRIVERLDAAFENIDKLKANAEKQLAEAQTLFQKSLAKAMKPKEGWEEKTLGDVAEVNRGRSKHRPRNDKSLFGGPYPFIQTGDIRNAQGGEIKDFSQTYSEFGLSQSKLWAKGTICITIAANIGETAILGFDACFPDSIVGIHPDETVLDALFLNYYLLSIKKEIDSQSYGTSQKNINLEVLNNIVMQIPPLAEQQRIVERLDSLSENVRKYEEIQRQMISECDALKQALLRKVFE